MFENLPPSLHAHRDSLRRCIEAMDRALPIERVILFGSHARGEARADSDVDLCLVSEAAGQQLKTARRFRLAMDQIWPHPSFSLLPITPERLSEKKNCADHFYQTVLNEGISIATQDRQ